MFKYGSFRLFLIKFVFGLIVSGFSIIYFLSLFSYDHSDPGFKRFQDSSINLEVSNYIGYFGAYLSSYSFVIFGYLSYIFVIFLFLEGIKSLTGFKNNKIFLKTF